MVQMLLFVIASYMSMPTFPLLLKWKCVCAGVERQWMCWVLLGWQWDLVILNLQLRVPLHHFLQRGTFFIHEWAIHIPSVPALTLWGGCQSPRLMWCEWKRVGWGFAVGRQKDKGKQKVREKVAVLVLNSWDLSEKLIAHQCPAETPLRKSACPRQQKRGMRSRSVSVSRRDMKLKKRGAKRKLR